MAVREDYEALERLTRSQCPEWVGNSWKTVVGCSLDRRQMQILKIGLPESYITNLSKSEWNLDNAGVVKADVIVVCNVLHYSPDPELWFRNLFACCKELWIQDLFSRRRGGCQELKHDEGDKIRYGLGSIGVLYAPTFDLAFFKNRLLDYWCYDAGSFKEEQTCINFTARFKGDL